MKDLEPVRYAAFLRAIALLCLAPAAAPLHADGLRALYSFPAIGYAMTTPVSDQFGNFFGTTSDGGTFDDGTVFELAKSDSGGYSLRTLYSFDSTTDGGSPGELAIDNAGNLFGVCDHGGPGAPYGDFGPGTVFELSPLPGGAYHFRLLHAFTDVDLHYSNFDGANPSGRLAVAADDILYGTTTSGGADGEGIAYSIDPAASDGNFTPIYSFGYPAGSPVSLVFDSSGNLFGSRSRGDGALGDVFELLKIAPGSYSFKILHAFTGGADGVRPFDEIAIDASGNLYGASDRVVFTLSLNPAGNYTFHPIRDFPGSTGAPNLRSTVTRDSQGNLFGYAEDTTDLDSSSAFELVREASGSYSLSALYHFTGTIAATFGTFGRLFPLKNGSLIGTAALDSGVTLFELLPGPSNYSIAALLTTPFGPEGQGPSGALLQDESGNLFTAMTSGGAWGKGTILELENSGSGYVPIVLHAFAGTSQGDGAGPSGGLSLDSAANLYGTTASGGTAGLGTVFQLARGPQGYTESIVYSFSGGSDGSSPNGVVPDSSGHLYGVTNFGGQFGGCAIYRLTLGAGGSTLTTLHSFLPANGSASPLVRDKNGYLFGSCAGEIFRISGSGSYSTLKRDEDVNGSALILDNSGVLYGTTQSSAFRIEGSGNGFMVLHQFLNEQDGGYPTAPLNFDAAGNLVGSTTRAGLSGADVGTVFRLSKTGSDFTVLHAFSGPFDGAVPSAGLGVDRDGNLLGISASRGPSDAGVLFRVEATGPTLSIEGNLPASGTAWVPFPSIQITCSGGTPPCIFGQSGEPHNIGVPPGLTFSSTGLLSGLPSQEGTWQFALSIQDANGFVASRGYSIEIVPGRTPDPPVADAVTVSTREGNPVLITLLGTDPNGLTTGLKYQFLDVPQSGTLTGFSDKTGDATYTPSPGFIGTDQFTYWVMDEFGTSAPTPGFINVFAGPSVSPVPPGQPITVSGPR